MIIMKLSMYVFLPNLIPGVASKLVLSVPGSAGTAGLEPSMDPVSIELVLEIPDFFFFCTAL